MPLDDVGRIFAHERFIASKNLLGDTRLSDCPFDTTLSATSAQCRRVQMDYAGPGVDSVSGAILIRNVLGAEVRSL